MNYSKKNGNLCKSTNKIRQNKEASLYCQQSQHHSLISILTNVKKQCRYELQIRKCKNQIEQKIYCHLSVVVSQPVDQYGISRIIVFLGVTARITNSPFFPLYSSLGINSKTCGY